MSKSKKGRRALQLGIGIGLSGLFLYLALRGEDWGAIGSELRRAQYRYLVAMFPLGAYALFARAQRWRLLLESASRRPQAIGPIFSASAIGFMANMVLPFRIGEFARPYLVSRDTGIPLSTALATAVVERVLDLIVLFAFAVVVVMTADVPQMVRQLTTVAGVFAAITAGAAITVSVQRARVLPLLDKIWQRLPKSVGEPILRLEHEFLDGMATIANVGTFVRTILWSFWIWLVIAFGFALGFLATGMDVPFVAGGVTVTTIVALAVSIPSAPAFVGQFEWGCKLALEQILGTSGASAVGYAILVHATQFVSQVGLGLVFVAREGLSFGELGSMTAESHSEEIEESARDAVRADIDRRAGQ